MRHYKKGRKLGTDASHTAAIKKNLVSNLFLNDRIKTTLERAKEIRGDVDRIITWAKRGDVHARRLAIAKLGDKQLVAEIFSKVEQGLFKDRPGGYTRIYKVGKRRGDDATIVLMELVQEPVQFKKKASDSDAAAEKGGLKVKKKASKTEKTAKAVPSDELVEAESITTEDGADAQEAAVLEEAAHVESAAEEASVENTSVEEAVDQTEEALVEEAPAEEAASSEEALAEDESNK